MLSATHRKIKRKDHCYGWDSVLDPDGENDPCSILSLERKKSLSHPGKATHLWADWLGKIKLSYGKENQDAQYWDSLISNQFRLKYNFNCLDLTEFMPSMYFNT